MKNNEEITDQLLKGGLVGPAIGALLSKRTDEGILLGALAGAAIVATLKASENASKTQIPLVFEQNHTIYEISADGTKKIIKTLDIPKNSVPNHFKLN